MYRQEDVEYEFVDYDSNQDVIDMIDKHPKGAAEQTVFALINASSQTGGDAALALSLNKSFGEDKRFLNKTFKRQQQDGKFGVIHYATKPNEARSTARGPLRIADEHGGPRRATDDH